MKYSEEFKEFYRDNFPRSDMDPLNTIIVLDTTSLLNIFRFTPEVSSLFFKVIEQNKEHLYIPYLVALEFHFNKKQILEGNNKNVQSAINIIEKRWKKLGDDFSKDIFKEFSFRNGKDAPKEMEKKIAKLIWETINAEDEKIKKEAINLIDEVKRNQEKLYYDLISVIEERTGDRYSQDFIDAVQNEGKERYANNIPPGYDDRNKQGYRKYNNVKYELKYGDLIVWKDLIKHSKENKNIKHVILVTSDGKSKNKNDLLYKIDEQTIGPRIELLHEMREEGEAEFYIIDELEFVEHFSKEEVSPQIVQAITNALLDMTEVVSHSKTNDGIKSMASSLAKVTSSLGNSFSSANKKREVSDVFDLENLVMEDFNIKKVLEDYLINTLPNMYFEAEYGDIGWGEFEFLSIFGSNIEDYNIGDSFFEIACTANMATHVEFSITTHNPDYEPGEPEFFYESRSLEAEFVISFYYDLDKGTFEDIEIIEFISHEN
ncbi:PIN-like domain-containing protein [Streptococcus suis]|uniref:PIN-like domain-containing protein n=1 Tax=Streptococcus suis TaxID=1307 RepID=UPI00209AFFFA|nr:PIN-like domain-containing protein [Streptococcus suis]MCO8241477.1 PIN-like domain-containing protein [Streptococcus suis]